MSLKPLLKRGALLAAANWPVVVIQLAAETTFQALLAVPIVGAAILVAVLLGADVTTLVQGRLRDVVTTIASALMSEPAALVAFTMSFAIVLIGGSVLMFLVKGGTIDVILAASRKAGTIEREPITYESLRGASSFTLQRFIEGCMRNFRPYLSLGCALMLVYVASGGAYLALVVYGYRNAGSGFLLIGWTLVAALAAGLLVAWFTIVNSLYLLIQVAIAIEGVGPGDAVRSAIGFVRAEVRELAGIFAVVLTLVVVATLASALAWSGVGLIAFVPLVGLAVIPLQIAALLLRRLIFEYIGLTAVGAYITLYTGYVARRALALDRQPATAPSMGRPA